jgi:hypothetical protein
MNIDPQNDYKLSYESIEKAEILNKYFCSISNLNDENKVLPDFDCRCLDVLSDIVIISCPTAFSTFNVEIISITSCSQTSISERTSKHLQSKSGKTLFSSFKLDHCPCYSIDS